MSFLSDLFGTTQITNSAKSGLNQALGNAGALTGAGQGTFAGIAPTLNREATGSAPGYGPQDLAQMINRAGTATAAKSGADAEDARLRAMRTGNTAAINASADVMNRNATTAAGGTLQDILAQNAALKQKQKQSAIGELGRMGTTQLGTGAEWGREVPADVQASLTSQQAPFEDLMKVIDEGQKIAMSGAKAFGG